MTSGEASSSLAGPRERWKLPPTVLPDGDERDLWIADGSFSVAPVERAEILPGHFALPGLVDAHAHFALVDHEPADAAVAAAGLRTVAGQGVLFVRDLGAPDSVTLDIAPDPALPRLIAAGRWLAPRGRFFEPYHDPVPPEALVSAALAEVERGARWIKVVADWTTPELSYDQDTLRELVEAVHGAGARVAAHVQWTGVRDVVAAGVDSIEHGCLLDAETLAVMAARGVAWTPTLTAFNAPLPDGAPPEQHERRRRRLDNFRALLAPASARGVTILAGTDTFGAIVDEVRHLIEFGLTPVGALRAATTDARAFFGAASIEAGEPADVVTFEQDPRDDPAVLSRPAAVVLRGIRIA